MSSSLTYGRLVQLKNGQWIDPAEIASVIAIRDRDGRGGVIINAYGGWHVRVSIFEDYDEAAAYRDFVASRANERGSRAKVLGEVVPPAPSNGTLAKPEPRTCA